MRYDQRDRFVRERTRAANRLRSAALLIGITELPVDITPNRTVRRLAASAAELRLSVPANVALDAILDEIEDACESIIRINERIKSIQRHISPLVQRVARICFKFTVFPKLLPRVSSAIREILPIVVALPRSPASAAWLLWIAQVVEVLQFD